MNLPAAGRIYRPALLRESAVIAGLGSLGLGAGYLVVHGTLPLAAAVALAPAALLVLEHRRALALLLAASLPFPLSLGGGGLGLSISASDVVLTVLAGIIIAGYLVGKDDAPWRAMAPIRWPLGQYVAVMGVVWAAHLGFSTLIQTGQRLELFLIPLLAGAAMVQWGCEHAVLRTYVLVTTTFAALYPFFSNGEMSLGVQKNPAGQFIANALLMLVALPEVRRRLLWTVPILTIGLLWTQSRGALVSVPIGLAALLMMNRAGDRRRTIAMLVPLAAVAWVAFSALPESFQERNTSFGAGTGTRAAYSLKIREQFREQAWSIVHARPWTGVGIGNYAAGLDRTAVSTADPHQVLLLQAAEGGYPFAASFVVLVIGCLALVRRSAPGPVAAAAGAVISASVAHGMVDVYWVRGTPVLGWALIGMALARRDSNPSGLGTVTLRVAAFPRGVDR